MGLRCPGSHWATVAYTSGAGHDLNVPAGGGVTTIPWYSFGTDAPAIFCTDLNAGPQCTNTAADTTLRAKAAGVYIFYGKANWPGAAYARSMDKGTTSLAGMLIDDSNTYGPVSPAAAGTPTPLFSTAIRWIVNVQPDGSPTTFGFLTVHNFDTVDHVLDSAFLRCLYLPPGGAVQAIFGALV